MTQYLFWILYLFCIVAISECQDISRMREDCIFDGKFYSSGSSLNISCFSYRCKRGWIFDSIDYSCSSCSVYMDPHIYSFDSRYYSWHGFCNYTLAQPYDCSSCSYNPKVAVYGDFKTCSSTFLTGSCVDTTTYKVDSNTVVTIVHDRLPNEVKINGNTFTFSSSSPSSTTALIASEYPVIVSYNYNCLYVAGAIFSLLACPNSVYIYTKPIYINKIHGLCGYYSGKPEDDFLSRGDCSSDTTTSLADFASSWMTLNQKEDCCPNDQLNSQKRLERYLSKCPKSDYEEKCVESVRSAKCPAEQTKDLESRLNNIIESCIEDCCLLPESCEEWIKVASEVANETCQMQIFRVRSTSKVDPIKA